MCMLITNVYAPSAVLRAPKYDAFFRQLPAFMDVCRSEFFATPTKNVGVNAGIYILKNNGPATDFEKMNGSFLCQPMATTCSPGYPRIVCTRHPRQLLRGVKSSNCCLPWEISNPKYSHNVDNGSTVPHCL